MAFYSQTDPRWVNQHYGTAGDTFGVSGCAVTADANLQNVAGGNLTPPEMDAWLKAHGGYANGDLLEWSTVTGLGLVDSQGTTNNEADLNQFLEGPANYAIVQFAVANHSHFCLATTPGVIIDSEDGKQKVMSTYQFVMAHKFNAVHPAVSPPIPPAPAPAAAPTSPEGTLNVVAAVPGYNTAGNASNRLNPVTTVQPGNYHVFNQSNGMVNVTSVAGQPGSWINPADNKSATAPTPEPANYDGQSITIQPGWGLSNAAQAVGYPDSNSPLRWTAIAQLNGSNDWQSYNVSLKPGTRIVVGSHAAPANPHPNIIFSRLASPMNLVTKANPTKWWRLDFATYADAQVAAELAPGTPFVAVGKAQRTDLDRPCYYMTAEDFGNADTTSQPNNLNGVNTVDLAPAPATTSTDPGAVSTTSTNPVSSSVAPQQVPIAPEKIISDYDKRFSYKPFSAPAQFVTVMPDTSISDLRTNINADGSVDFPLPDKSLVLNQPVLVAGTMNVNGVQYYRTAASVKAGNYYAIPVADLKPAVDRATNAVLKLAAGATGLFSKLFHRNSKGTS